MLNEKSAKMKIVKILIIALAAQAVISIVFVVCAICNVFALYPTAKLTLYQGPKTMTTSADTKISVNGRPLFVYETNVNNTHTWVNDGDVPLSKTPVTYFDMDGTARIDIQLPNVNVTSAKVIPEADAIKPKVNGHNISFEVGKPGFYTVEYNNSVNGAIHIFVNPIEKNIPNPKDPKVIYIGPGEWNIDSINVNDGQTLYIAGGAVVHGTIHSNMATNVTIRGRGIIDGSAYESWLFADQTANVPIDLRDCKNINVEGLIFLDPNCWTFNAFESENAHISNVKLISARPNGDGFTFQSCRDIYVDNCFARTWDDSLVVKNYSINTDNVNFNNMQVWTDLAQSCEIGYETNKGKQQDSRITNVTFSNITVLHNFHKPVIGIDDSDNALVKNITYKNIVVEDAEMGGGDAGVNNQLIDINIAPSTWSSTADRGNISDVTINGLKVLSGLFTPSRITGYDETHTVSNVSISNVTILGKKITSLKDLKCKSNIFTSGITMK